MAQDVSHLLDFAEAFKQVDVQAIKGAAPLITKLLANNSIGMLALAKEELDDKYKRVVLDSFDLCFHMREYLHQIASSSELMVYHMTEDIDYACLVVETENLVNAGKQCHKKTVAISTTYENLLTNINETILVAVKNEQSLSSQAKWLSALGIALVVVSPLLGIGFAAVGTVGGIAITEGGIAAVKLVASIATAVGAIGMEVGSSKQELATVHAKLVRHLAEAKRNATAQRDSWNRIGTSLACVNISEEYFARLLADKRSATLLADQLTRVIANCQILEENINLYLAELIESGACGVGKTLQAKLKIALGNK